MLLVELSNRTGVKCTISGGRLPGCNVGFTRCMTMEKSLLLSTRLLLCKMELIELPTTLKEVMCVQILHCARHRARSQPLALAGSITSLSSRGRNTPIKAGFLMVPKAQPPERPKRNVTLQGKTISSWRNKITLVFNKEFGDPKNSEHDLERNCKEKQRHWARPGTLRVKSPD